MRKILLLITVFVSFQGIGQYTLDRIAYDSGPGGNDTLYLKTGTDSLFRFAGGQYIFTFKSRFRKFIPSSDVIGGGGGSTDWADITNKPETFTPSAHNHAIGDVTNLQSSLNAKADLNSPTLVTPNIGAATGASVTVSGQVRSTGTAGIGYASTAGGTVTQATNKSTAVTLNKICGQITMNAAALAAGAEVAFTLNNSTIAATDVVIVNVQSVGTTTAYLVSVNAVSNGSCVINISNASAGSLSQAIVLNFVVIKSVNN